ncbi:MFS transporter [Novosphingobium sp.]|uniref:MFS transporter n=1 Tax=Novosphingobium sp. TaxID=1874826 RepID=UPI00286CBE17|nr:MFS transporter [Novosphingobium sp.]
MADAAPAARPDTFVLLYALAWAGGAIAYTPLLMILLPSHVANLAGTDAGIGWLARIALAGALVASLGNVVFGYLSDITGNRRGWIAGGLVLSALLLPRIGKAQTLDGLIMAVVAWQLALNMMLAPLAAWAGDRVPDSSKGLLGGLMAIAPGAGALSGALVTQPGLIPGTERLAVVALIVAACVVPVLWLAPPGGATGRRTADQPPPITPAARRKVLQMWGARLSVQIAEATLFAYLLFWLRSLDPAIGENKTALLFSVIMVLSIPVALAAGRWSDRVDRPIVPLAVSALVSAAGLIGMALAADLTLAMAAYGLFGLASAVFLSLHSSQTLRILPRPGRRGRDLGLFNLTNTVPSLIMPWLAITLVPLFGYQALFVILAALALCAAALLATITPQS